MDLSSEEVFEFLDLLEKEVVLWNPKHPLYNNRNDALDSWKRIQESFSVDCSLEELKKKRISLMAIFRRLLRKVKASIKPGEEAAEIYKPTWFAYERMAKFLIPVYESKSTKNAMELGEELTPTSNTEGSGFLQNGDLFGASIISDSDQEGSNQVFKSSPSHVQGKRKKMVQTTENQSEDSYKIAKTDLERSVIKEPFSCDLHVKLLIKKLKEFDEVTRVTLMHDIDSLVFRAKMKQLKSQLPASTTFQPLSNSLEHSPVQSSSSPVSSIEPLDAAD